MAFNHTQFLRHTYTVQRNRKWKTKRYWPHPIFETAYNVIISAELVFVVDQANTGGEETVKSKMAVAKPK
jgi:hypothetical protein